MILDNRALFSDEQDLTAGGAGDVASTNSYDLGVPGIAMPGSVQLRRRIGVGNKIPLLIQITETVTSGDGLTSVDLQLQSDEDSAFGSAKTVFSVNVLIADLVAGFICPIEYLPRDVSERYLRVYYNANGGTFSAGKVTAGIVAAVDGSYQG